MIPLVQGTEVTKSFGGLTLFRDSSFSIDPGDKIGLIGRNGAGKTTLFKIVLGQEKVDYGDFFIRDGIRIGWLSQYQIADSDKAIAEELQESQYLSTLREEIDGINAKFADPEFYNSPEYPDVMRRYTEVQDTMARYEGQGLTTRAEEVLERLGFEDPDHTQKVRTLSGGERRKVALARILVASDHLDLILLDEPTNHLDLAAIEWLEEFIIDYPGAAVVISHDRYFLDNTVDWILELESPRLRGFKGNYSEYEEIKKLILMLSSKRAKKKRKEIERQRAIIQKLRGRNKYDAQIKSRLKRLEKVEHKDDPLIKEKLLKIEFKDMLKSGRIIASLKGVKKAFDQNLLFKNVNIEITKGEKIGLLGPNGSGKTTMLKLLTGEEQPTDGEMDLSPKVRIGYFDQGHLSLDPSNTLIEELQRVDDKLHDFDAKALLGRFGFASTLFKTHVQRLSGGERARLAILKLVMSPCNLLLLDEPTNHLDILSRKAVEAAINTFPGTVIVSSHDRYFLDNVVSRVLHIHDHGIHSYPGGYTRFRILFAEELARQLGERKYVVTRAFTDWTTGTKYHPNDTLELSGEELKRFQWALDTGRVEIKD